MEEAVGELEDVGEEEEAVEDDADDGHEHHEALPGRPRRRRVPTAGNNPTGGVWINSNVPTIPTITRFTIRQRVQGSRNAGDIVGLGLGKRQGQRRRKEVYSS